MLKYKDLCQISDSDLVSKLSSIRNFLLANNIPIISSSSSYPDYWEFSKRAYIKGPYYKIIVKSDNYVDLYIKKPHLKEAQIILRALS